MLSSMKLFACQHCDQILFFENVGCTRCGHRLAYLSDRDTLSALDPAQSGEEGLWQALAERKGGRPALYRLCANYVDHGVCNWAVPVDDPEPLCRACRLNGVIPNLGDPGAQGIWARLEVAKHRLVYTLLALGLPVEARTETNPRGLTFEFKRDVNGEKVLTGHHEGIITLNVAEAEDPFREKMRVQLGEAYRTLLGHFRHEIGHYYWQRLIAGSDWLERFRERFGDETADYAGAVKRHYAGGPPPDWQDQHVSAYASMHPWEDWAESFAHYLHMVDTLETARAFGLALRPEVGSSRAARPAKLTARRLDLQEFDELLAGWIPLTLALNSLNRSMGLADLYPFVLSATATDKMRFVHDLVLEVGDGAGEGAGGG
jgi:hypothetical protein